MKKITLLLFATIILAANSIFAQCDAPNGLIVSYNNNVTTFSWDPVATATDYIFELGWAGGTWGLVDEVVSGNSYSITGIMQGGNFQWRVRANCNGNYGSYSTAIYSSSCLAPYNLTTTSITLNSAVLNWVQSTTINNSNTGFSISYRLANTTNNWIQLTNIYNNPTATFFNLTGLTANTVYEWRARRVCSYSNSDYIYSQFTTAPIPVLYCTPYGTNLTNCNGSSNANWINYFKLGSINRTSVSEPGGYANIPLSTDLVIGSTNNAGQISVGFSGRATDSRFMVWIDFNRNGSFLDAGERLIANAAAATITGLNVRNFAINIPANVTPGNTRMRVFTIRNAGMVTNPCLTNYLGETEDYTVNLVAPQIGNQSENNAEEEFTNVKKSNISVGPNPSNGIYNVNIKKYSEVSFMEIINSNGMIIQKLSAVNKKNVLVDITNVKAGIYILKVTLITGEVETKKLIKI